MKTLGLVGVFALLLAGTPAFAQMAPQLAELGGTTGSITLPEAGYHHTQLMVTGKIGEIDLAGGTVTLDNGTHFTLAPTLQLASFPAVGQDVEVLYDERGGQRVVRSIGHSVRGGNGGSE